MQTISKKEDERIDFLMKILMKKEAEVDRIKAELRKLIYKLDRKI